MSFWPDPKIFEDTQFSAQTILERLQMYAFLNAGLEIRFVDEREGHDHKQTIYRYEGGIIDFVGHHRDPLIKGVLEKISQEAVALKVLGSYPKAVL